MSVKRVAVLSGGVGGAKFLLGARKLFGRILDPADPTSGVSAIVNVGDDAWMHGIRICPDLDSCMYTLGGGFDHERGWGQIGETFNVMKQLIEYKSEPTWFGLGDKDIATHLIRTHMLSAGYPLSAVTDALCVRWDPGVKLIPASNDRHETHVIVSDNEGAKRAIHFQEWWVKERAGIPTHGFAFVGATDSEAKPAPQVIETIMNSDVILVAPSNPVVSIGAILSIPGIRAALKETKAPVIGFSPIIEGQHLRGMAQECLKVEGYDSDTASVAQYLGWKGSKGILDGWIVDSKDQASLKKISENPEISGLKTLATNILMTDEDATAKMIRDSLDLFDL